MKRTIIAATAGILLLIAGGCGSAGGGSHSAVPASSGSAAETRQFDVKISSGDGQTGIIGTALKDPLTAVINDQDNVPLAGKAVHFSIKAGKCILSATSVMTGEDGKASVSVTLAADIAPVQIEAAVDGVGAITFTETPRLPLLGEVLDATLSDGGSVAFFPSVLANFDGEDVIVLLNGTNPFIDTDFLPKAGDLPGGTIKDIPAEEYPVVFLPITSLVDAGKIAQTAPAASMVNADFTGSGSGGDLPVVTNLLVNGSVAAVGIIGDASGIPAADLGDLIAAGSIASAGGESAPVADLPVYLVKAADFPEDPATDQYSYFALPDKKAPLFDAIEAISGSSTAEEIPVSQAVLSSTSVSTVSLTDGIATRGLLLLNTPPLAAAAAPEVLLRPLPPQFIDAFNVIQNQLAPLIEATGPQQDAIAADMEAIGQIALDNQDLITNLLNGQTVDTSDLLSLANQLLPYIDDIVKNILSMLPNTQQQLTIVENQLLPAINAGLPADGGVFGGYSDSQPSTIRDNVIPFLDAEIECILSAMPTFQKLLQDIDTLIPDDGNVITLLINASSGQLNTVLDDVTSLVPYIADGLEILYSQGIPILYDVLEELEHDFPAGQSPVSGTTLFQSIVASLEAAYPPDTTLGDLPGFDEIAPLLGIILPAEWGNPADVSLFNTLIPAIGAVDIGADILPLLRQGLDALNGALPGIIDYLNNFQGFNFSL